MVSRNRSVDCGEGASLSDDEHLVTGDFGKIRQRGGSALQVPDVHHQTGRRVISRGDELRGQPEVGDVGEGQRFQRYSGSDLGGLPGQLVQLGGPVGDVGQWRDGPVDDLHVGSDLDLSRTENLCGGQQRPPCLVRLPTATAGGPPVLEQLDLEVDQAEVVADASYLRQVVGGLGGIEVVDGEPDTGEAGGGHGLRPGA